MISPTGRPRISRAERERRLLAAEASMPPVRPQPLRPPPAPAPLPSDQRQLVVLVGCVAAKLDRPAPARDLYTSTLFRLRRRYAEQHAPDRWAILSALHGLVGPDQELRPYNWRLADYRPRDRWSWSFRAFDAVVDRFGRPGSLRLEIHAGEEYWRDLAHYLRQDGAEVEIPTRGMAIGRQLQWYKAQGEAS